MAIANRSSSLQEMSLIAAMHDAYTLSWRVSKPWGGGLPRALRVWRMLQASDQHSIPLLI